MIELKATLKSVLVEMQALNVRMTALEGRIDRLTGELVNRGIVFADPIEEEE